MRRSFIVAAALAATLFGTGLAAAQGQAQEEGTEKKVTMQDLPPAVQQAVKKHSFGAKLRGLTQETKDGSTFYEAELDVNGRTRDVTFDRSGKLISVEEEVAIDSLPAAARAAIRKAAGTGKITLVETVTEGGTTVYEAHIQPGAGKAELEVKVDAKGNLVK